MTVPSQHSHDRVERVQEIPLESPLVDGEPVGMSDPRGRGAQKPVYLSELLPQGEHTVVLRSRSRFNVDSFIFWDE